MFMLEDLKLQCSREIAKQITVRRITRSQAALVLCNSQVETVFGILQLCDQRSLHELKRTCIAFLITNLDVPALRVAFTAFIS